MVFMKTWGLLIPSGAATHGLRGYVMADGIFIPVMSFSAANEAIDTLFANDAKVEIVERDFGFSNGHKEVIS